MIRHPSPTEEASRWPDDALEGESAARLSISHIALTPKQGVFVYTPSRFPCYAGGFGAGKTLAGCARAWMWAIQYPGSVGLIGRLTYEALRITTRKTFFESAPGRQRADKTWFSLLDAPGTKWRAHEKTLTLPNQSQILFWHLDTVSEQEIRSLNLQWFFLDQAEELSESIWLALLGRLRGGRSTSGWITCNPARNWVYRYWKQAPAPDTFLIESRTSDNPYLPPDYEPTLRQWYPPEWIDRFVEGHWTAWEGQIFPEFTPSLHIHPPPVIADWPPGTILLCGIDPGYRNPTAAVWGLTDYGGRHWIVAEYEERGKVISDNVKAITRHSAQFAPHTVRYVIDPSVQQVDPSTGRPRIREYREHLPPQASVRLANHDVLAGIARIGELLHQRQLVIAPHCPKLATALQDYTWKPPPPSGDAKEIPQKTNDHLVDALRYLVMTYPLPPTPATTLSTWGTFRDWQVWWQHHRAKPGQLLPAEMP